MPCAYQPCTQTRTGVEPPVKWMVSCAYVPLVPGVQVLTSPVEVPDAPMNTNAPRTQAVSVYAAPAVTGMVCPHSPVVFVGVPTSALVPVCAGVPVPVSAVQVQPAVPDSNPGLATSSTAPAGDPDPTSSPAVTMAAVAPTTSAARNVRIATPRPLVRTGSRRQRDHDPSDDWTRPDWTSCRQPSEGPGSPPAVTGTRASCILAHE